MGGVEEPCLWTVYLCAVCISVLYVSPHRSALDIHEKVLPDSKAKMDGRRVSGGGTAFLW